MNTTQMIKETLAECKTVDFCGYPMKTGGKVFMVHPLHQITCRIGYAGAITTNKKPHQVKTFTHNGHVVSKSVLNHFLSNLPA